MNPLFPIVFLLLGAGTTLLGLIRPFRFTGLAAAAATLLAILSMLIMGGRLPARVVLSAWRPETLFPLGLRLTADRPSWILALALLVVLLAIFLTGIARLGGRRIAPRAASLVVTASALTALFADSLVALAVSWAALDTISFLTLMLLTERDGSGRPDGGRVAAQAVVGLALNVLATVLAVAAALEAEHVGSVGLLGGASLPPRAITLLILAAVFRLNIFPFHHGFPAQAGLRQGIGTILRLAPMAVAVDVLAFVVLNEPNIPLHSWLTVGAVAAALLGAWQWWSAADPRQGLSFVVLAHAGLIMLAGLWGGGSSAAGVVAQGLALLAGGATLFVYNGYTGEEPGWLAAPAFAGLILTGLPLTVGFVGMWTIYGGMARSGAWLGVVTVVITQSLLAAGYLRIVRWPGEPLPAGEQFVRVVYLFGLGLPLLFATLAGLAPGTLGRFLGVPGMPGLGGMLLSNGSLVLGALALAVVLGLALWRFEALSRAGLDAIWAAVAAVRLDWLYSLVWDVYRFVSRMLRAAAAILEGEGGVLWALVVALLVWLALGA